MAGAKGDHRRQEMLGKLSTGCDVFRVVVIIMEVGEVVRRGTGVEDTLMSDTGGEEEQ